MFKRMIITSTYNRSVSTLQEWLVVYVHNSRKQILKKEFLFMHNLASIIIIHKFGFRRVLLREFSQIRSGRCQPYLCHLEPVATPELGSELDRSSSVY